MNRPYDRFHFIKILSPAATKRINVNVYNSFKFRRILSPVKTESTSTSSYCATVTMIAATTVTNLWTTLAVKVRWNSKLQFTLNMCDNISKWCPNLRLRLHVLSVSPFFLSSSFYLFNGHNTCELILSVKVPITVGVMLNFDGDFDGHGDDDYV